MFWHHVKSANLHFYPRYKNVSYDIKIVDKTVIIICINNLFEIIETEIQGYVWSLQNINIFVLFKLFCIQVISYSRQVLLRIAYILHCWYKRNSLPRAQNASVSNTRVSNTLEHDMFTICRNEKILAIVCDFAFQTHRVSNTLKHDMFTICRNQKILAIVCDFRKSYHTSRISNTFQTHFKPMQQQNNIKTRTITL